MHPSPQFVNLLEQADLKGKLVAVFGLGDQSGFADTYCDAMGILAQKAKERGALLIGQTSAEANIFAGDYLTYGTQTYILMGVGLIFCTGLPFKAFRKYREKPWMSIIMLAIFWYAIYNLYQSAGDPFMYFNF